MWNKGLRFAKRIKNLNYFKQFSIATHTPLSTAEAGYKHFTPKYMLSQFLINYNREFASHTYEILQTCVSCLNLNVSSLLNRRNKVMVIVWHALHKIPMFSTPVHNKNLYLGGNRAGWPLHPIDNKISDEPKSICLADHAMFMMLIPRKHDRQSLLLPYDEFSGRNES